MCGGGCQGSVLWLPASTCHPLQLPQSSGCSLRTRQRRTRKRSGPVSDTCKLKRDLLAWLLALPNHVLPRPLLASLLAHSVGRITKYLILRKVIIYFILVKNQVWVSPLTRDHQAFLIPCFQGTRASLANHQSACCYVANRCSVLTCGRCREALLPDPPVPAQRSLLCMPATLRLREPSSHVCFPDHAHHKCARDCPS